MKTQSTTQFFAIRTSDSLQLWGSPRNRRIKDFLFKLAYKLFVLSIILILISIVQTATANTGVEMEMVGQGTLFYKSAHDDQMRTAPMLKTDIELKVTGFINRAHITQTFRNGSRDWVEGVYVFPLPENAAVDHMRIRIGDRIIEGQIKERAEAKKTYELAKSQGKRASLLEQERPNMFTTSVANIGPLEEVNIEIEFQQIVRYDQGQFRLRFPMAITPRYIPGTGRETTPSSINSTSTATDQVIDADRITPIVSIDKKVNPVSLSIELDAGFPVDTVESSYHSIDKTIHDEGHYTINLTDGVTPADRDFELIWKPVSGNAPRAAMFKETVGDQHYYLVMMLPPSNAEDNNISMAKEVIYVIDTSGSMGGVSIRQARKALLLALNRLRPQDSFNIIQFNSTTDKLFTRSQTANIHNIAQAQNYVTNLEAQGGTEMMSAMRAALSIDEDTQQLRQVIFLTDGAIGNEDALFEYIRHHLGSTRLFTVGIGSAPNSHFMTKSAQFGRGTFTSIGDVNEVSSKMQALFAKLDTPIMRDLAVVQHFDEFEMWPQTLPDLYSEEPLVFTARSQYDSGEVLLHGKRNAEEWQARFHLQSASVGVGIGKLWARNKIDAYMDSLHDGADKDSVRNAVLNLSLTHHLVSKYASLVAVDVTPVRPKDAILKSEAVPGNLPHGQEANKIFGLQAKTGTEQYLLLVIGSLMLLFAIVLTWLDRRPVCVNISRSTKQ